MILILLRAAGNVCLLSESNIGTTGALKPNREFDYYEMRDRSINCDGKFVCGNRKCIDQIQVCNGKNDCNDRSDESICTVENLDYAIRLAGSDNVYEGRVEVKSKSVKQKCLPLSPRNVYLFNTLPLFSLNNVSQIFSMGLIRMI